MICFHSLKDFKLWIRLAEKKREEVLRLLALCCTLLLRAQATLHFYNVHGLA